MPNHRTPYHFIVDLILENERVQILEFGAAHQSSLSGYNRLYPAKTTLESRLWNGFNTNSQNPNMAAICSDKGLLYALLTPNCPTLFPTSHLYPFGQFAANIPQIMADFKNHSHIVLKYSDESSGIGVNMLPIKDIVKQAATLAPIFGRTQTAPTLPKAITALAPRKPFIDTSAKSHFVVQSLARATPIIRARNPYAPVMRTVLTLTPQKGRQSVLIHHGSYYKLPKTPINDNKASLTDIYLSDIHRNHSHGPVFARVPKPTQNLVLTQLNQSLLPALEHVYHTPTHTHINALFNSQNSGINHAALKFILMPETQIPSRHLAPIMQRFDALCAHSPAAQNYVTQMARQQIWSPTLEPYQEKYTP